MSRVFQTKRQRLISELPKRSDEQVNLGNVEVLLSGIMEDLDTILDEWKDEPSRFHGNRLSSASQGTRGALKYDTDWLRDALGIQIFTQHNN